MEMSKSSGLVTMDRKRTYITVHHSSTSSNNHSSQRSEADENGLSSPLTSSKGELNEKIAQQKLVSSNSSVDTMSTSTSPASSCSPRTGETISTSTTSRMENGEPLPRLAPGIYHKKPAPILTNADISFSTGTLPLPHPSKCASVEMRGPPPAWLPPCPPDRDHDYENNYEDPEDIRERELSSRDLLLNATITATPPKYNSYETSLSQQRRTAMNEPRAPPMDEWTSLTEGQTVLHKNADGAYYIPSGSVRTTASSLSPSSQTRYFEQCRPTRSSDQTTALIKYPTTASIVQQPKRRISKKSLVEMKPYSSRKLSKCSMFLAGALLVALVIIILLLLRSPSYVYGKLTPLSTSDSRISIDETSLRPLPLVISLGQRVEADILPQHMITTELFIARAGRVVFNVTVGAGTRMVLLGRHGVIPSLSLHDFYHPIRADRLAQPGPSHSIDTVRHKRETVAEILAPRYAIFEHFLVDGLWYLSLINERNRVEPISLIASMLTAPSDGPADGSNFPLVRCEAECNGHGECLPGGRCRCTSGYTGESCEEPICPVVCSGNGVFSGGACVCRPGFKGKECDVHAHWCEIADCSGHGRCGDEGMCRCDRGWTGDGCELRACPQPTCSDHGVCVDGRCYCAEGWKGENCSIPIIESTSVVTHAPTVAAALVPMIDTVLLSPIEKQRQVSREVEPRKLPQSNKVLQQLSKCGNHGKLLGVSCQCDRGWEGQNCEREACPTCEHGVCIAGRCICESGWRGDLCDQAECSIGCAEHGKCLQNGTCSCDKGWNGGNCYIDGCPLSCSHHGECRWGSLPGSTQDGWRCECQPSFVGEDCAVPVETDCQDGLDNDNDGLVDCDDPECCASSECSREAVCATVPAPVDVLLRLPSVQNADFFQRVSFIIRNDSVQSYSDHSQFNGSIISVIRGRVVWNGGASTESSNTVPLPGVRVSDAVNPLYGFTLTRLDGEFDLLVNGGRTVNLQFLRSPFQRIKRSVYVPPNEIVVVDSIKMVREEVREQSARPECLVANRVLPNPVLRPDWTISTDGVPISAGAAKLLVDTRSIIHSLPVPGSSIRLVYDSTRASASKSTLVMGLIGDELDRDVRLVHVVVDIAGRTFKKRLIPRENLTYVWSWDKLNVYRQSDHGMVAANVRIGYEYRGCTRTSEIAWISRRVHMEGARARRLEGGAWSVDIHHYLDVINGVLEMGNGGRRFIANNVPNMELLVGTGKRRRLDCENCNGIASESALFRPSTLAHGLDGSLFIGDHNFVRRLKPNGQILSVLSLSLPDTTYPYYLAVSPIDGSLAISLPLHKQIWKITSHSPTDPASNHEVLAGDGTACPSAADACGDGGPAIDAQLFLPKGLAYDAEGDLYVTDGRRLRVIDVSGNIRSIGDSSYDHVPSCDRTVFPLTRLQLHWPTSLSVHLPTGYVFVLDSNVVYQIDRQQDMAEIVIGALTTCQNSSRYIMRHARDIAVDTHGSLYVLESDGKKLNQIRRLSADRMSFSVFAGQKTTCSCDNAACGCDDATTPTATISAKMTLFNAPLAVSVDAVGHVYVADTGNLKVKRIVARTAQYDTVTRQYHVVDGDRNELFLFNRYGLHTSTQSLVTGAVLYNFTYNVDTSLGQLTSIQGAGGYLLRFVRLNDSHCTIEAPSGQRTMMVMSIYDGVIESMQTGTADPVRLNYLPGGLLISRTQGGSSSVFEYNDRGQAVAMRRDGEEFRLADEQVSDGRVTIGVLRNGVEYATFASRVAEVVYEDSSPSRIIYMDDGFSITHNGITSLLDAQTHPAHGETSILKMKTTVHAIQDPARRSLTSHFDWRPFVKRGGAERRLAEVGARPRVNGVNAFTVTFDRIAKSDVISTKSEEATLRLTYMESGELQTIAQDAAADMDPTYRLPKLVVHYDSLGRRNEIVWGNRSIQVTYDRQNRIVERSVRGGVTTKYAYSKDFRHPVMVQFPGDLKYSLRYDARGGLREVTTPSSETHHFASTPFGGGRVVKRRVPFIKKPFVAAEDNEEQLLEWVTADELHHVLLSRDKYGHVVKEICDSSVTTYSYDADRLVTVSSPKLFVNFTWQGPLLVMTSERRQTSSGWRDSSFAVEHNELMRPTSIQAVIAGTAVEPIQLVYDERTAFMSSYADYQILRESTMVRIHGFKMMHERSFDAYRQVSALKIVVGDIRLSLTIVRDLAGRTSYNIWRTPTDDFKEIRTFDVQGRLATCEITGKERFLFKYNNDSRIALMNDVSFEWHTGGVPKKAGRTEYAVDGNGWTIKRGDIGFEMDCYGRLVGARGPSIDMKLEYDHQSRLISIRNGAVFYSLFYTLPHLPRSASHFQSSSDSSATTVLYTEEGVPFAMNRDGFRYAIAVDDEGSLRYLLSETGVEKEIHRDPFGRIIIDTQSKFWVPLGFHGGVDIPELSVAILPNGRPYDTVLGRYMSFGPIDLRRINFDDILRSVDPFSLEQPSNAASLTPTDMKTWFRLVGLSPVLLPPADLHLTCQHSVCTRSLASFPSRLRTFSQLPSLSSIELLDTSFMAMYPSEDIAFAVEDAGFHELLVLTPNGHKTTVDVLPLLSTNESDLIKSIVEPAQETNWRVFGTSWERHLVRPDDVPSSLTSLSMPHFTLVVSRGTAELRNGKTKIFVHFSSDADTVNKILMEDFRRREGPTVWRAERRRIERGESTQPWTQQEKRELLSKGAVTGYTIEMDNSLRARFSSVHIWRFVKTS